MDERDEELLAQLYGNLEFTNPGTEDYTTMLEQLARVKKMTEPSTQEKEKLEPSFWKRDVVISSAAQLIGLFAILNFEKLGILTSKATTFIPRIKS